MILNIRHLYSLRINASFDEVWRCLVYTRDQEDSWWAKQERLWWSVDETEHSTSTKSATLLLGINRPEADSIYDINERRLYLFQGAEDWTVMEVHADPSTESQSDPEAMQIFEDFLKSFEQMFERLGYEVIKMRDESGREQEITSSASTTLSHPELNDALNRRSLALFIGADLPCNVTGLPSRADLARDLARRKGRARSRVDESLSLAEAAQRVARGGNRWDFTAFIRDQLDTTGKSPQPFHRRIVKLVQEHGIETIITTAYDNLLELAFQEAGIVINRVVRGSDVSFMVSGRPTLIKLYGDTQQPDTLVVTEDDHYSLWRDREKEDLLHEVHTVLRRQTVLFLGYNLADPDFNLLWREVLDRAGRFARTAYAVWPGLPEDEVQMWRDRGIVILDQDPLGVLDKLEGPAAAAGRSELEIDLPTPKSSVKGADMDYELGFQTLKACLAEANPEKQSEVATLEDRFSNNQRAERLFGSSENTRNERSQINFSLNELALKYCGISFNEMCQGKKPPSQTERSSSDVEVIERLRRIEEKDNQVPWLTH